MDLKYTMINLRQIFTWWHKQTFGTFLKTLFFGKLVGEDEFKNRYYQSSKGERWVVYFKDIEATKITSDWHHWIHHTVDSPPAKITKNFLWQKKHSENLTGTTKAYKPTKIEKSNKYKKYETWKN